MDRHNYMKAIPTILAAMSGVVYLGAKAFPAQAEPSLVGTRITAAIEHTIAPVSHGNALASQVSGAIEALASSVRQLSHPRALEAAFGSYFAFKAAHPEQVKKPLLYFVDYGLSSRTARGYVFDMDSLKIVDGPFMVADGRGSAENSEGIPTRFSNAFGAATTSLGLYVAQETYSFTGHTGGHTYSAIGMRLDGVSTGFNDNARARGVVAHGAPYVTQTRAGRSEGCPALEPARAQRLLPQLANGGLVFLFAPDQDWMNRDPWIAAQAE